MPAPSWGLVKSIPLCQASFCLFEGLGLLLTSFPGQMTLPIATFVQLWLSPYHLPSATGLHAGEAEKGKIVLCGDFCEESLLAGYECVLGYNTIVGVSPRTLAW